MDYKNGKIYSIRSYQTDEIYIGSTCSPLNKTIWNHKAKYKQYLNDKSHYLTSFEILKYDDYYIELIELYPCNSKIELHKKQGEYIRDMDCVNKVMPGRTNKESCKQYRETNKNKIKEKGKIYRENNKEKISLKGKIYREKNKEKISLKNKKTMICICGSTFRISDKSKHYKTKKHRTYIFNLHNELNHL